MRGPLLSGAVGSRVTLERLAESLRGHAPTVVLSTVWLAQALAEVMPIVLLVEPEGAAAAARAARKRSRLTAVVAGEDLPLRPSGVPALVVEGLHELARDEARAFMAGLLPYLPPGGRLISLDGTKSPAAEAELGALFLAAGVVGIAQERPREGAVITSGSAPAAVVVAARARALGLARAP